MRHLELQCNCSNLRKPTVLDLSLKCEERLSRTNWKKERHESEMHEGDSC